MRTISQHYKIDLDIKDRLGAEEFARYKNIALGNARWQFGQKLMKETLADGEVLRFKEFVFDDMRAHVKELLRTNPDSVEYKAARLLAVDPMQYVHVFHVARIAVPLYPQEDRTHNRLRWLNDIHWWE